MCANHLLFKQTQKPQKLSFGGRLVNRLFEEFIQPATKIVQHFGGFFHQIKVCQ
jgi:hypothetical protein